MLLTDTRDAFSTLHDAVTLNATDDSQPAIVYLETDSEPVVVSRADFSREVMRCAGALTHLGMRPHDLIVIAHTQSLESIYAFWGALMICAIPSMFPTLTEKLDPDIYMRGMAELARLSEVRAVLTTDDFAPTLRSVLPCDVYSSADLRSKDPISRESYFPEPDAIAFLQHSSGTTGLQKGVALSHRAVLNQIASYSAAIGLNSEDVVVSWLPLYHDMGLIAGFLLPLIQGVPLVLMSPFDWVAHPALLFRAIHDYKGTLCWLPNFAYNHCARRVRPADTEGLSAASIRMFINCSEPVHAESHRMFLERFAEAGVRPEMLTVSYAMAENVFAVTQTPLGGAPRIDYVDAHLLESQRRAEPVSVDHPQAVAKVSCGAVIVGTQVKVLDDAGEALPERAIGEIAVKSDCMLTEYYRRPDLNPFHDGWYRTGDMGYVADGEVYIVGRAKDLIINAGKNVYPQDIEAIANTVAGVYPGRAVAFGVYDEREGTELIALVAEVTTDDPDERQRINRQLRAAVAQRSTVTLGYLSLVGERWLVKTSSGKIARAANRDKWLAERAKSND